MIADAILSLQNGYENRGMVIPYLFKSNNYDCCVKVGNDLVPQKVNYKYNIISLVFIPVIILKQIDCFIGEDTIIDLEMFKVEIAIMKELRIDIDALLFISNNTCVKTKDGRFFLKELDGTRIYRLFGFIPNIISKEDFITKYTRPLFDGSGGFNNCDGTLYNRFETLEITPSTLALSNICHKNTGNIVGVFNIVDSFKHYTETVDNTIFNYLYDKFNNINQFMYIDLDLNYTWIDLDKIEGAIKTTGSTIICILGLHMISDIDYIILKSDKTETRFNTSPEFVSLVKKFISRFLKQNMNINELLFF